MCQTGMCLTMIHSIISISCSELTLGGARSDELAAVKHRQGWCGRKIYIHGIYVLKIAVWKRNHRTSACYATNTDPAPSNGCQISPGLRSHVSQGQAAIKDVSGLSMKTGRAVLLQIFTNGESQAIQCAMRSHRSPSSQKFTSAKPVIDICQRERMVDVSSKAAGRWRLEGGRELEAWESEGIWPQMFETLCGITNAFIPVLFMATRCSGTILFSLF